MLLQKRVEQHRVHRFIADGVRLAFFVPRYQIGVRNFFCHFVQAFARLRLDENAEDETFKLPDFEPVDSDFQ